MRCTVEFGRKVEIVENEMISCICYFKPCNSIVEARKLKAQYGGKIIRQSNQTEVF